MKKKSKHADLAPQNQIWPNIFLQRIQRRAKGTPAADDSIHPYTMLLEASHLLQSQFSVL
jgi:hypothetical protein